MSNKTFPFTRHRTPLIKSAVVAAAFAACGTNQSDSDSDEGATALPPAQVGEKGAMELRLVDAPTDEVKEIVVTITKVTAHAAGGGGWLILGDKTATIDLLELQGGSFAQLGVVQMPAGRITQMRLYVKEDGPNYVTTPDGAHHPLTVPSGPQSGIKIKAGFEWPACAVGNVTIDMDGKKSIFVHPKGAGAGDEWLLRPVVRLKSVVAAGDGCGPDAGVAATPPVTTPPLTPPPADTCASVTCATNQYCNNGHCAGLIE
jgi:uncharacterized protein DUF4382